MKNAGGGGISLAKNRIDTILQKEVDYVCTTNKFVQSPILDGISKNLVLNCTCSHIPVAKGGIYYFQTRIFHVTMKSFYKNLLSKMHAILYVLPKSSSLG